MLRGINIETYIVCTENGSTHSQHSFKFCLLKTFGHLKAKRSDNSKQQTGKESN